MKVFLSWSGERSKQVASLLKTWLKCVIQSVDPWMSSQDISRGELWYNAINNQIAQISTGIICLTEENKEKPWILFESGALAKGISTNHIITLLIDLKSEDLLLSPLSAFNHTTTDKDGVYKMVLTINNLLEVPLEDSILNHVFEMFWPTFEEKLQAVLTNTKIENTANPKRNANDNSEMLKSMLISIRNLENNFANSSMESRFIETKNEKLRTEELKMVQENLRKQLLIIRDENLELKKLIVQMENDRFANAKNLG